MPMLCANKCILYSGTFRVIAKNVYIYVRVGAKIADDTARDCGANVLACSIKVSRLLGWRLKWCLRQGIKAESWWLKDSRRQRVFYKVLGFQRYHRETRFMKHFKPAVIIVNKRDKYFEKYNPFPKAPKL